MFRHLCILFVWTTLSSSLLIGLAPTHNPLASVSAWEYQSRLLKLNAFFNHPRYVPGEWQDIQSDLELMRGGLAHDLENKICDYIVGQGNEVDEQQRRIPLQYPPCLWSEVDRETYSNILEWFLTFIKTSPGSGSFLDESHRAFARRIHLQSSNLALAVMANRPCIVCHQNGDKVFIDGPITLFYEPSKALQSFFEELDWYLMEQDDSSKQKSNKFFQEAFEQKNIEKMIACLQEFVKTNNEELWRKSMEMLVSGWLNLEIKSRQKIFQELLEGGQYWHSYYSPRVYSPLISSINELFGKLNGSPEFFQYAVFLQRSPAFKRYAFNFNVNHMVENNVRLAGRVDQLKRLGDDAERVRQTLELFRQFSNKSYFSQDVLALPDQDQYVLVETLLDSHNTDAFAYLQLWPDEVMEKMFRRYLGGVKDRDGLIALVNRLFSVAKSVKSQRFLTFVLQMFKADLTGISQKKEHGIDVEDVALAQKLLYHIQKLSRYLSLDEDFHSSVLLYDIYGHFLACQKHLRHSDPAMFMKEAIRWRVRLKSAMQDYPTGTELVRDEKYRLRAWLLDKSFSIREFRSIKTYEPKWADFLENQSTRLQNNQSTKPWQWRQVFYELYYHGVLSDADLNAYKAMFFNHTWVNQDPAKYLAALLADYEHLDVNVIKEELQQIERVLEAATKKWKFSRKTVTQVTTHIADLLNRGVFNSDRELIRLIDSLNLIVSGERARSQAA